MTHTFEILNLGVRLGKASTKCTRFALDSKNTLPQTNRVNARLGLVCLELVLNLGQFLRDVRSGGSFTAANTVDSSCSTLLL